MKRARKEKKRKEKRKRKEKKKSLEGKNRNEGVRNIGKEGQKKNGKGKEKK